MSTSTSKSTIYFNLCLRTEIIWSRRRDKQKKSVEKLFKNIAKIVSVVNAKELSEISDVGKEHFRAISFYD